MRKIIRWKKHWKIEYIYSRLSEMIYQHKNPECPWLTRIANFILASYLKASDVGLEFGSGRSTIWFAQKVRFLTSVEHDQKWYDLVSVELKKSIYRM